MNEYEYRIPLFGPNYSNCRIIRIICDNTDQKPAENVTTCNALQCNLLCAHQKYSACYITLNILYYLTTDNMKSCCGEKLWIFARNCQVYLMEKLSFHTSEWIQFPYFYTIPFPLLSTQLTGWVVTHFYCNIIYQT